MKKIILSIIVLAIVGVGIWLAIHNRQPGESGDSGNRQPNKPVSSNTGQVASDDPQGTDNQPRPQSAYYVKPATIPIGW